MVGPLVFAIEPAVVWGMGALGIGTAASIALKKADLTFPNEVRGACLFCHDNAESHTDVKQGTYTGPESKDWSGAFLNKVDDLLDKTEPGDDTKGKTDVKIRKGGGGFDQANDDFDDLDLSDVRPIETEYGPGRTGKLPDDRNVTVRPGSSDGRPTLEIRKPRGGRRGGIEIRY